MLIAKLIESLIYLLLILPFVLLGLNKKSLQKIEIITVFGGFLIFHSILLFLPDLVEGLRFTNGKWNWSGKIYAIIGSVIFLLVYRRFKLEDFFITTTQNKRFLKKGIVIVFAVFVFKVLFTLFYFDANKSWNLESVLFQATVPGLDEEFAYRAIMFGLLIKILKPKVLSGKVGLGSPAIWITTLLFAFAHSLHIGEGLVFSFDIWSLVLSMFYGFIWGYLTLKSGSILLALISHNLGNIAGVLLTMNIF